MEYNARASSFPFNGSSSSSSGYHHSSSTPGSSSAGSGASGNSSNSHGGGSGGSGSGGRGGGGGGGGGRSTASQFDVINWYPKYQSCQRYFLEVAQHSYPCQALAAFINIKLPFQRVSPQPPANLSVPSSRPPPQFRPPGYSIQPQQTTPHPTISPFGWVSLHPYMRRLVATGFDVPAILHGWFGDDWESGVGPLHEQERRNYLFAAKSGGWASVKKEYDVVVDEAIPYLMPLSGVDDGELEGAESLWSRWLAMEDWMLGSRAPVQRERRMDDEC